MSDQAAQPSQEELREALGQMRAAPAEQVLAEVLSAMLNAAQVKLGRRDARLLLDLSAQVTSTARPHLSAELASQLDDALAQLRVAQVEAERDVAEARAAGQAEPNDLASAPATTGQGPDATAPSGPPPAGPSSSGPSSSAGSRLWVPGR